ncbi:PLAC8-domain-containing protein [Aulographum hederae CBS 113979]|uniref:PLAC8-domain-containing protein n=1 Tax=Aulographum hederae CBS 113979 TaxID=1176131 RepID=A0A6G1H8H7_9PEZI|nr:PLAC8-domain-containing protein [Aulographum hederae CBS 113979]
MDLPQTREWQHGICGCGSACFMACCCPCFTYGKVHYRLKNPDDPTLQGYSSLNSCCCLFCLVMHSGVGHCVLQLFQRIEVREDLGIQGNAVKDCLVVYCCTCCSMAQNDNETKSWVNHEGQYAAPAQMMYAPPTMDAPPTMGPGDGEKVAVPGGPRMGM